MQYLLKAIEPVLIEEESLVYSLLGSGGVLHSEETEADLIPIKEPRITFIEGVMLDSDLLVLII